MIVSRLLRRRHPLELFALGALLVCAASLAVVRTAAFATRPETLGLAVTVDLVVGLPALYWLLLVRPRRVPAGSAVAVAILGWLLARLILPEEGQAWAERVGVIVPLLEAALLALVAWKGRRIARAYRRRRGAGGVDALEDLRAAFAEAMGAVPGVHLAADEIAMWVYALGGGGRRAQAPGGPGARAFTVHRRSGWGAIVLALALVVAVEAVAVHALLARWSPGAAWVVTALTLYGVVWLFADWRATRRRPVTVEDGRLHLRMGLRWTAEVPLAVLTGVSRVRGGRTPEDALLLSRVPAPNLLLRLERPVEVRGPYGIRRQAGRLALFVDEPAALAELLAGKLATA